jgi:hypothetical protein
MAFRESLLHSGNVYLTESGMRLGFYPNIESRTVPRILYYKEQRNTKSILIPREAFIDRGLDGYPRSVVGKIVSAVQRDGFLSVGQLFRGQILKVSRRSPESSSEPSNGKSENNNKKLLVRDDEIFEATEQEKKGIGVLVIVLLYAGVVIGGLYHDRRFNQRNNERDDGHCRNDGNDN